MTTTLPQTLEPTVALPIPAIQDVVPVANGQAETVETVETVERGSHPWRWSSEEYHRLGEAGFFEDRRVELIEGEIIEMPPISGPHLSSAGRSGDLLGQIVRALGREAVISIQNPIRLSDGTEPQPDVAVLPGTWDDYDEDPPTTALLVVEISYSTLADDRVKKLSLYARALIQEYWIVNVKDRQLEVHRSPIAQSDLPYGFGYAERRVYAETESVSPLIAPDASILIADLLPKVKP